MNALLKALALTAALLVSSAALAGEAVPVNAKFGIQWTPVDWSNPFGRITESLGAAGLPNGKVLSIYSQDSLDAVNGRITSEFVAIAFSDTDVVYVKYENIPAVHYPETNIASFFGPMTVLGGRGSFRRRDRGAIDPHDHPLQSASGRHVRHQGCDQDGQLIRLR